MSNIPSSIIKLSNFFLFTTIIAANFFSTAQALSTEKYKFIEPNSNLIAQNIIPAHPDAIGGGNPLQGLGRPDDPEPSRVEEHLNSLKVQPASSSDKSLLESSAKQKSKNESFKSSVSGKEKANKNKSQKDTILKTGKDYLKQKKGILKGKENSKKKDILKELYLHQTDPAKSKSTNQRSFVPAVLNNSQEDNSPHRKALSLIQKGKYTSAQTLLEDIKIKNTDDLKARYLLAIVHVMSGENKEAIEEYQYVIKHSKDLQLTKLAEFGLKKISQK